MTFSRDYRDLLNDIQEAAQKAIGFTDGMSRDRFAADDKTMFAVSESRSRLEDHH